jgi:hypothetical protein
MNESLEINESLGIVPGNEFAFLPLTQRDDEG